MINISISVCFLLLLINIGKGATTVDTTNECTCEELTSLIECASLVKCGWKDNKCESIKCFEAKTKETCTSITDCAWYKGSCSEFSSCEKYDVQTFEECIDLHSGCIFTPVVNTCTSSISPYKCSELTSLYNCSQGADGKCIYVNDQCKLWTQCEEATEKKKCSEMIEKCKWDEENEKCMANLTCQDLPDGFCKFAFSSLTGKDANICNQNEKDLICQDFNPDETNEGRCIILSWGYYKWTNGACKICDGTKHNYQMLISIFLLINILLI